MNKYTLYGQALSLAFLFLALTCQPCFSQSEDDIGTARAYSKKFKGEDVISLSSYQYFTFDKGKNSFNEKVVVVEEDGEYEFLALKKYANVTYAEFYNKFIQLNSFKRAVKYGSKYITLEKGGVDRSVTDEGIFFDDSRVQYFPIRFPQQGSTSRVTVKKTYVDGKYLTRVFFHQSYPVKERVVEFKVPEWLNVEFRKINFEGYKIEVQEKKKGGYTFHTFIMKDIPAYKNEYKRIGRAYSDPHIVVQIRSFLAKGNELKGFDKVDDVYAWNYRLYQMASNNQEKLRSQLSSIIQGKNGDIEKIKAIYYWVQDNIRYIAYEDGYSGYIPAPAHEVLSNRYGDCKGMANLLTEFLKLAGYDANFSWIGTRHLPYLQSLPALCVNNHAICTLNYNGETYFLDGTEKYVPLKENAFRIQGKEVLISGKDKFEIRAVPMTTTSDNMLQTKANLNLVNTSLKGKVNVTLTGNQRTEFHQVYHDLPSRSQKEFINDFLEFGNDNMVAANVKTSKLSDREIPVSIEADVDLSNMVISIGNDKYAGLDFFPRSLDNFIPDEKRVEGYDLDDVIRFEDEISLTIPPDMQFTDIPTKMELKREGYEFQGEYIQRGNTITLKKVLLIKNGIIRKSDFPGWIEFVESIKIFSRSLLSITKK